MSPPILNTVCLKSKLGLINRSSHKNSDNLSFKYTGLSDDLKTQQNVAGDQFESQSRACRVMKSLKI